MGDHSIDVLGNSGGESSDHSIDVPGNSGGESSKPCIFKVPAVLRRHSPKSFTPNSFSFGPLHYKKKYLKATEEIKKHYLDNLLSRKPTHRTTLEEFKRSILEVEGRARKCYAFPTDHLNQDQFVDMLVVDGCFIIELLRNSEIAMKKNDDPVFSVSWVLHVLHHDLILLENQIPWFVLVRLFNMTASPTKSNSTKSLTVLALNFFGTIFSKWSLPIIESSLKINHILDLLRNAIVSSSGTEQQLSGDWQLLPTAASLKESGIRFKKRKSTSNFLDIKFAFKYGVLKMPPLLIQDITCEAFRNLISYEQCYPNCEAKITSYAVLLNNLINTTKDLKVLRDAGVVDTCLNPNDTLEFFKNIYTDTYVKEFYYVGICRQVKGHTDRWWPRTRAAYVHIFSDPIGCLTLFAAAIALILTLLQTFYAVMQYKKDSSHSPPPPS